MTAGETEGEMEEAREVETGVACRAVAPEVAVPGVAYVAAESLDLAEETPCTRAAHSESCRRPCNAASSNNDPPCLVQRACLRLARYRIHRRMRCSCTLRELNNTRKGTHSCQLHPLWFECCNAQGKTEVGRGCARVGFESGAYNWTDKAHGLRGCGSTPGLLHCSSRTCRRGHRNIGGGLLEPPNAATGMFLWGALAEMEAVALEAPMVVEEKGVDSEMVEEKGAETAAETVVETAEVARAAATVVETVVEVSSGPDCSVAAAARAAAARVAEKAVDCPVAEVAVCTAQARACGPPYSLALRQAAFHTPW